MKRHAPYTEASASPHAAPSQRQPMPVPRAQHSSERSYFKGNPNSLSADEAIASKTAKVEWMWQLERDAIASSASFTPMPSRDEAVTSNGTRPYIPEQTAPVPSHPEEQAHREPSSQPQEQDMEIGYEDDGPSSTLWSLEQKFFEEVMQLVKEQDDASDAENTRHRERIIEINDHFRDKLSSLRSQQASRRKEFLLREQKEHLNYLVPNNNIQAQSPRKIETPISQHCEVPPINPLPNTTYQAQSAREMDQIPQHREVPPMRPLLSTSYQAQSAREMDQIPQHREVPPMQPLPNTAYQAQSALEMDQIPQHREVPPMRSLASMNFQGQDARGVEPIPFASASRESLAHRAYSTGMPDLYRDLYRDRDRTYYPSNGGSVRTQETEERVPLPAGRVYNTSHRYQSTR